MEFQDGERVELIRKNVKTGSEKNQELEDCLARWQTA